MVHDCRDLIRIFDHLFLDRYQTCLVGGAEEPLYLPASHGQPACILFRSDFYASALHEVAHWCIAGAARRRLQDYGYWYAPEGRSEERQSEFQSVEVAPQALEWIFADAAGYRFHASLDNPGNLTGAHAAFEDALRRERCRRSRVGLPPRARLFRQALEQFYSQPPASLCP